MAEEAKQDNAVLSRKEFLSIWEETMLPDARFGILNGLGTGELEVEGLNKATCSDLGVYIQFLFSVVKQDVPKVAQKALHVIFQLKNRYANFLGIHDDWIVDILKGVAGVDSEFFAQEPLRGLANDFLSFKWAPSGCRFRMAMQLDNDDVLAALCKGMVVAKSLDLLDDDSCLIINKSRRQHILNEVIRLLKERIAEGEQAVKDVMRWTRIDLSQILQLRNKNVLPFSRDVKDLLLLEAKRGDLDALIPIGTSSSE